ncbi:magnesium and cobalt transport protein CorA [Rhodococcus triatomae]|uniref:Magnesium transporter n=1 Tax=Rhodococcus triatomae TaxID=300028 RepID=A0A1G8GL57_9NOCA|nr:magnesium and cobalt transport protein CorA [Rhodococcus triatomae]QNG20349.1 magnesium and cobalt transport protein CorA [Rhodococcus triatomae]QNG23735.1 magnesium and cobalt transport protein CorA [Rhodococcus triatomae]SDH95134.1 magnesium transporter [Rhodococcus triatomae]
MREKRPLRALLPLRSAGLTEPYDDHATPRRPPVSPGPIESTVVNSAVYRDGKRIASPATLGEALSSVPDSSSMAWIGLYRPTDDQLYSAAKEFDLHELAVEDAISAHQRPKLERYGETLFVVLRAARYNDDTESVEFGELHVFCGPTFVLTVRHSESPDLSTVRDRMEGDPDLLRLGPEAVLYAILDAVVDGYAPVVAGLQNDIDEIETEVFSGAPGVSRRIYELTREVIEFQRATRPLLGILQALSAGFAKYQTDEELQRYLRDVNDHATIIVERADGFRQLLGNILTVNATLVSQEQNEEMRNMTEASYAQNEEIKKVSAWAAILFAPTLIGTVYGMNFDLMPELHWDLGYPFAVGLMALICICLYTVFKRRGWL